ncbi:Methyltransferase type 11 [Desulfobulbus propionicus DSM 2032]|uniref:Methyltransferase type 11 n=1 Tax=Desulfobulbus propionicus (strain ATCC 33891 / DSM 2032 / VKM B-1956 / 1pr3) TaxID=577650 RepID=A0A7U3YMV7_DESPD|nr:class I SAM-dependent methyltransferase [Desulfobulbus propionicus]ADW18306.1 Methyltransferase type 11 [Desulfobulbus propionicus DSM 2032]
MKGLQRLGCFIDTLKADVYPEIPSEPHLSITRQMIERLLAKQGVEPGQQVLDIGCGQGLALRHFLAAGLKPVGIALGEDVLICQQQGLDVRSMDQSFLEFDDNSFDIIWCRHALEHSIFPYFTLAEFKRVLRSGGRLYIEVPAPDTSCHHETNPNHYSVLGKSMWRSLFVRAGFAVEEEIDIDFTVPAGPDQYWSFFLSLPA